MPCCDDAVMAALTLEEIATKIATAESGFAAATSQYDRNVLAQILDEYKRYAAERAKQIAKQAAAVSSAAS
jgi:iron uptake system EfeUOB component EfeO/EfeM